MVLTQVFLTLVCLVVAAFNGSWAPVLSMGLPTLLLFCLFLTGVQSTLFGPVKYAILPQVLAPEELTGGNGLVEMGTSISILIGMIVGMSLLMIPG